MYFAIVQKIGDLPNYSEMGEIGLFDCLPDKLTYPILRECFSIAERKWQSIK